jgi:hypothetical protein
MSDSTMQVDGGCHCGAIKYSATINPDAVGICHCHDCQVLSGTAFRVAVGTKEADFRLQSGTPKIYVKTAESGNPREQAFCGDCGSHIYATSVGGEDRMLMLRAGTLSQFGDLTPARQIWAGESHAWTQNIGSMPALEKQS